MATRLDKDHPNVDFNCRYFKTNIAINAVQICVCTAFALVPRKVLILQETSANAVHTRSEEHTSELQSLAYLVCRLLLEKKKKKKEEKKMKRMRNKENTQSDDIL